MTKQQLAARVQQLEAQLPVARPATPANIKANRAGLAVRKHIIQTTAAVKSGAVLGGAVTKGFFAGLFGR